MSYSSSLTDREWEILEPLSWCAFPSAAKRRGVAPLLPGVLPQKKRTKPLEWSYRALIDGMLYRLKNGYNWEGLPKDLPPYSTVFYHYNQWRKADSIEKLMKLLHEHVREQVKKSINGPH